MADRSTAGGGVSKPNGHATVRRSDPAALAAAEKRLALLLPGALRTLKVTLREGDDGAFTLDGSVSCSVPYGVDDAGNERRATSSIPLPDEYRSDLDAALAAVLNGSGLALLREARSGAARALLVAEQNGEPV